VDKNPLFHDGNSKVWLIDEVTMDGTIVSKDLMYDKSILVFYESGNVNMIPMNEIGDRNPKRGYFFVNSNDDKIMIEFGKETWDMRFDYITEDSVKMLPNKESDVFFELKIIPFPEL
jgi:hypothetical protein